MLDIPTPLILAIALVLLPIAAACLLLVFGTSPRSGVPRWIALGTTIAALIIAGTMAYKYYHDVVLAHAPALSSEMAAQSPIIPGGEFARPWLSFESGASGMSETIELEVHLGLDGISVALMVLTALLSVSCVLISWNAIRQREAEYYVALLFLEAGLFGVFCAFDLILFYVFFEFTLIPLFFLIAIWGGPQRRLASIKFFLYTLAGSLVTLLGVVMLASLAASSGLDHPTSLPELAHWFKIQPLSAHMQVILFLMLAAGFLLKVPIFPFHTWLPLAHVEAPTAGSVLLAGVLLKLGSYGFLRICMPLLPAACTTVGVPMIAIQWGLVAFGILSQIFFPRAPRVVFTAIYLTMGWLLILPIQQVLAAMTATQQTLLWGGGAAFTLGALFYATKRPLMLPGRFSFHELFHVMVLVGAGCHYAMIYSAFDAANVA
jgi:NADH-quinone oxidoreductase subunit M